MPERLTPEREADIRSRYVGYIAIAELFEEIDALRATLAAANETIRQLRELGARWENRSAESLEEGRRIRGTVKEETRAEARCGARAEVWDSCAIQLRAALLPPEPVPPPDQKRKSLYEMYEDRFGKHYPPEPGPTAAKE